MKATSVLGANSSWENTCPGFLSNLKEMEKVAFLIRAEGFLKFFSVAEAQATLPSQMRKAMDALAGRSVNKTESLAILNDLEAIYADRRAVFALIRERLGN